MADIPLWLPVITAAAPIIAVAIPLVINAIRDDRRDRRDREERLAQERQRRTWKLRKECGKLRRRWPPRSSWGPSSSGSTAGPVKHRECSRKRIGDTSPCYRDTPSPCLPGVPRRGAMAGRHQRVHPVRAGLRLGAQGRDSETDRDGRGIPPLLAHDHGRPGECSGGYSSPHSPRNGPAPRNRPRGGGWTRVKGADGAGPAAQARRQRCLRAAAGREELDPLLPRSRPGRPPRAP